jgi:hypothetical protein
MVKKAVIIYWSKTGNTEKVAHSIKAGLEDAGLEVSLLKTDEADGTDYFDYDLVCLGFPSYSWHPPKPMEDLLKSNFRKHRSEGKIKPSAPKVPGKNTLIFCTYSGPHTGLDEATPAGDYAGQFFEHIGFTVLDKWYVLSEFHGWDEGNIKGRMGDIRGLPSEDDLKKIRKDAKKIADNIN